ncbi:DUF6545 domain-containing protein [Dactylosporangium matsuzakiense]|uniref:DUF6545 domain-containing protein n=1 Tax=Dactylosporangium matsuzakiense TaxID=53360 RepID=A0A9W6KUU9_9ACTN|nr:DUF6545 domain-containing protein [Dactylosporangium matsuzakiense]UWZ44625.1 hypothetical protein Dmats_46045 [Dactylosporangium matsuzakiense]GLL08521.1 hypothetical protein GCM10017581_102880 [Dactylosporangium matsuzakiense]
MSESMRLLADARHADIARHAAHAARAAGLDGLSLDVAVEAAILAAFGRGGTAAAPLSVPHTDTTDISLADDFVAKDAAWLLAVAASYRPSPAVLPTGTGHHAAA